MRKPVCGVGVNDASYRVRITEFTKLGSRARKSRLVWECPFYSRWVAMLRRCYSKSYQEKYPTYANCKVCDEWLTFSNFKAWMERQDWQGKELDKDLLVKGNKIYSPEKCTFLDSSVNSFILDRAASRGALPIGVSYSNDMGKYQASCGNCITKKREHLGYFDNEYGAHAEWLKRKIEIAHELAGKVKDEVVADALRRYYE